MQKVFLTLIFLLSVMGSVASAAEISTDKMILAWQTSKVWVSDMVNYVLVVILSIGVMIWLLLNLMIL